MNHLNDKQKYEGTSIISDSFEKQVNNRSNECFFFCCSPSLAIIDSWISVIYHLKQKKPDSEFIFYMPKSRTVDELDLDSTLIKIASKLFDRIVFCSHASIMSTSKNFEEAKKLNHRHYILSLPLKILLHKIQFFDFANNIQKLLDFLIKYLYKDYIFSLNYFNDRKTALMFDIYESTKEYNSQLMSTLSSKPIFSISHGIDFEGITPENITNITDINTNQSVSCNHVDNVVVYTNSNYQKSYFQSKYGLNEGSIRSLGVPRHDIKWIDFLLSQESNRDLPFEKGYISFFSRPGTTDYHPKDRKIKAIEAIQRIAMEYNLPIIVKLHPKEKRDGTFERVFGLDNYGSTWAYSNAHPFALAKNCAFAVVFISAVTLDMVKMGVPVIEILDLRGLEAHDNNTALRDQAGDPVKIKRYLGLVLGASDYAQLKKHVDDIMTDRQKVVNKLQAEYAKYFNQTPHINEVIANEICEALDNWEDIK
ncbi:hypothetical protein [Methanoplanus endosymbiosus]|uniref:Uncharacterized protein n=1 Tax=Methanoplanus endosymbiosus TaxID=33865 RepID=A0A9E7TH52_9EURY|nr:hypothetical protein [Methanoplanus endosymbiosus]UUX92262.1 hypothetical protein L6E24_13070 [Methanoplanus endosymbiosus]